MGGLVANGEGGIGRHSGRRKQEGEKKKKIVMAMEAIFSKERTFP